MVGTTTACIFFSENASWLVSGCLAVDVNREEIYLSQRHVPSAVPTLYYLTLSVSSTASHVSDRPQ